MKTKEEIEQMAEKECVCDTKDCVHKKSYIKGYTQCQKDMAEKKYTESQLRDAMEGAMVFNKLKQITEYIISLNKQD
jgi:hypothetical protein